MELLISKKNNIIKFKKVVCDKLKLVEKKLSSKDPNNLKITSFNIENWKEKVKFYTNFNLELCDGNLRKPLGKVTRPLWGTETDYKIRELDFLISFYKYNKKEINRLKHIVENKLDIFLEEIVYSYLINQLSELEFIDCLEFLELIFNPKMQAIKDTYKIYTIAIKDCKAEIDYLKNN